VKAGTLAALLMCPLILSGLAPPAAGGEAKPDARALIIVNPRTGLRRVISLAGVRRLTIRFFHSYDRQWVEETFRVKGGRFVPTAVVYRDDSYDYRDTRYHGRIKVGRHRIRMSSIRPGPTDALKRIVCRVAYTRPQRLILSGPGLTRSLLFTRWGRPGERLIFHLR
jgi:hypothetical protein